MLASRLGRLCLLLLLGAAGAAPPPRVSASAVVQLYQGGECTRDIALGQGCTRRRVQQILAGAGLLLGLTPVHPDAERVIHFEVARHGPNYGGRMLLGALKAHHPGWHWSRDAVYAVLRSCNPAAHAARRDWAFHRIGREHYFAPYFGYSVHIDLACKIQEYHLFVFAALDGCSRRVLGLCALTNKMPITVYEDACLPVLREHGMPDQMVTDKGSEFQICAFAAFMLAGVYAHNRLSTRAPQRCVPSKRNTVVERFNYEINMRVLIYFRRLLNYMIERDMISKYDPQQVHAFSSIAQPLSQYGLELLKAAWNEHGVSARKGCPGTGGVPNARMRRSPHPGPQVTVPPGFDGVAEFEAERGEPVRRVPAAAPSLEPLLDQPAERVRRAAAIAQLFEGDMCAAWSELVAGSYGRFLCAYYRFLEW